ncbi:hypothetical protein [Plantactinospora sp. CA-290183]|uniref:hypothetical protein n=1 Tax=Plantactinospora sp. CA-290183 TaxID=3240006 RepID=UPI003D8CA134
MRVFAAVVPALALALVGCGTVEERRPAAAPSLPSPAASGSASPGTPDASPGPGLSSPSASATPGGSTARPSTNARDCFDGDCRLLVSKAIRIRLDSKKFYYPELAVVAAGPDGIQWRIDPPHGGRLEQSVGPGGQGSVGFRSYTHLDIGMEPASRGRAVLVLTPRPS